MTESCDCWKEEFSDRERVGTVGQESSVTERVRIVGKESSVTETVMIFGKESSVTETVGVIGKESSVTVEELGMLERRAHCTVPSTCLLPGSVKRR